MRRCLILKKARFWRAFCYASYCVGICSIGDLEADIIQMRVLNKLRDVGKVFEIPAHEFRIGQVLQTLRIGRNNEPPLPRGVFPPAETDHKIFELFGKSLLQGGVFRHKGLVGFFKRRVHLTTGFRTCHAVLLL